jgi:large subunit ribosomal protein L3
MSLGILGKKLGMTQLYDDKGMLHPVTVISAGPCPVLQVKTPEKDKYAAYQLGFDEQTEKNVTSAMKGHFKKAKSTARRFIREFRSEGNENLNVGDTVTVSRFAVGQKVDVIGVSKGKGFQGVVRRHRFGGGGAAHGSKSHRRPGAIGMRAWPGRIWKNARMAGHTGVDQITVQNLIVLQVKEAENILLVSGSVPGSNGSYLIVRPAIKKRAEKAKA